MTTYADLPLGPAGFPVAWDETDVQGLGLLGRIGAIEVLAAVRCVSKGSVFSLNWPADQFDPPLSRRRGVARHTAHVTRTDEYVVVDDVVDNLYPQASSQWDALGHFSHDREHFYNGASHDDVVRRQALAIDGWAARGIVGRGVVVDLAPVTTHSTTEATSYSAADLERELGRTGTSLGKGDLLMLHTGFARWICELGSEQRTPLLAETRAPGLENSKELHEFLWDHQVAGVVSDTYAVEVWPPRVDTPPDVPRTLHQTLIGAFGLALGELWRLDELVADCRDDGRHECLVVSAPSYLRGCVGAQANALALK